jgi:hypothetical protein
MPYIPKSEREQFQELTELINKTIIEGPSCTKGQLNYLMTKLALAYMSRCGKNYNTMNDVMGVFTNAANEFYRVQVAPYEDLKIDENGDV